MKIDEFLKFRLRTLEVALKEEIEYDGKDYFKDLYFVPNNLTSVSLAEIDLSTKFLGFELDYPISIGALVGGTKKLTQMNKNLSTFTKKYNIVQGIGDQIFGIHAKAKKEARSSYEIVRKDNPSGFIMANLSAKHLATSETYLEDAIKAIDLIHANALEIYLEPLVNILSMRESPGTAGFIAHLKIIVDNVKIPVIVKSKDTGLSHEDVRALWDIGVSAIDISGVGGTSFARIETLKDLTLSQRQYLPSIKQPFDFCGIPTVWSLLDIVLRDEYKDVPLIIGGGIRDGRQAVKALALGADLISLAYPILIQLTEDLSYPEEKNLEKWFDNFIHQMKITMCLLGAKNIPELREIAKSRVAIFGKTKEWLNGRSLYFPPKKMRK